ncbi:3-isopropylmalate dehydratase, large subunit [Sphingobium faniae]|nr:3-isopropylmalate dehydratase, large subunit [Sphingobium faniae]
MTRPRTLYAKIWETHLIDERSDGSCLLWIDRHVLNEGTSIQAFDSLREAGLTIERREMHLAVADHAVPTDERGGPLPAGTRSDRILQLERNCTEFGIPHIPYLSTRQGICHVIAPEQGFVLPGMVAVCGDSHTATLGAMGALGFGIGTSEIEQVLATGTLIQQPSKTMAVEINGILGDGINAKDVILHLIGVIGAAGGTGYAIEYRGSAIEAMSIEARMTLSNMSVEAGARVGMIAPDEQLIQWLHGRALTPRGAEWDEAVAYWRTLPTDPGATFDRIVQIKAADIAPQVTWGTSPEHVVAVGAAVPDPESFADPTRAAAAARALAYQGLQPGTPIQAIAIDRVFIGSCTNARLSDLRAAANVVRGRHLASHVEGFVVPGSTRIRRDAEEEGLDRVFIEAGFEWRHSGCSMCGGAETAPPGTRIAATSNRNFEHRQGRDVRTHLVSPAMAAAAGIAGHFVDIRQFGKGRA